MSSDRIRAATPVDDPTRVTVADLSRIDQISALLSTLNDPSASADALGRHVQGIPVLRERIAVRFARRATMRGKVSVAQQITILGNRELERILLELLEDIVTLHSEQDPGPTAPASGAVASPSPARGKPGAGPPRR